MPDDLWNTLLGSDKVQAGLAGAAGGAVGWATLREGVIPGTIRLFVGCICAIYLGPIGNTFIGEFFSVVIPDHAAQSTLSSFLIGTGGMSVVRLIMDTWRAKQERGTFGAFKSKDEEKKP